MKQNYLSLGLLLIVLTSVPACSQTAKEMTWQSPLYQDHPLVGRIWRSSDNQFVSSEQLFQAIGAARYMLLGEKHDNPDHHALQVDIIGHLIEADKLSAAAFEMMDSDHQSLLENISANHLADLQSLHDYLQWDDAGWDWSFYGPLLLSTLQAEVPVAAANINAATMTQVYSEPLSERIAAVLQQDVVEQLHSDIDDSHCGLLPESQFPAMVRVQQARDQQMASSMITPEPDKLSLLVAGNYHIRRDLGVPNYLRASRAGIGADDILSIALMEVSPTENDEEGDADVAAYLQQFNPVRAYDYIWFTPVVSEQDYCDSLR